MLLLRRHVAKEIQKNLAKEIQNSCAQEIQKNLQKKSKECCKRNPGSLCAVAGPAPRILSRSAAHPHLTHGRLLANMNILFNISKDQQNRKCTNTTKLQMNFTNKKS